VSGGGREHRPGQKALVLIHGSGMNHTEWALQNRFFAHRGINVFSLDLPGHGQSDGAPLANIEQLSAWLESFFASAGLSSATILGHSMGALVGIHFAATHTERCDAVILIGVAANMAVHPELLNAAKEDDPLAVELLDSWCNSSGSLIGGHSAPGAWLTGSTSRLLEAAGEGVLYTDLNACDQYADAQQNFERIGVPLTVIAGAEDKMTPARAARELARTNANATFVIIDDAGHNMMFEQPDEFNQAVRNSLGV
jgi:pimeloyl-ACP methyl ester carboxylesterase